MARAPPFKADRNVLHEEEGGVITVQRSFKLTGIGRGGADMKRLAFHGAGQADASEKGHASVQSVGRRRTMRMPPMLKPWRYSGPAPPCASAANKFWPWLDEEIFEPHMSLVYLDHFKTR